MLKEANAVVDGESATGRFGAPPQNAGMNAAMNAAWPLQRPKGVE
jgi:hypothetical protein